MAGAVEQPTAHVTEATQPRVADAEASGAMVKDLSSGKFVQKRITAVQGAAKSLYTKMEDAGSHSSLLRMGLNTFEKGASWLNPSLRRLGTLGEPVVRKLDNGIAGAYNRIDGMIIRPAQGQLRAVPDKAQAVRTSLVNSAWFQRVDAALRGSSTSVDANDSECKENNDEQRQAERVTLSVFYSAAVDSFLRLEDKTYEEFVTDLRAQLKQTRHGASAVWDERLVAPAKVFWVSAQEKVKEGLDPQKLRLEKSYSETTQHAKELLQVANSKVKQSFEASFDKEGRVATNARALYASAMQYYEKATQHEKVVAVTDLVAGMKAKLQAGGDWKESLRTPLVELFTKAKETAGTARVTVHDRVQVPVENRVRPMVDSVTHRVDQAKQLVTRSVAAGVQTALNKSELALDYILPEEKAEAEPVDENAADGVKVAKRIAGRSQKKQDLIGTLKPEHVDRFLKEQGVASLDEYFKREEDAARVVTFTSLCQRATKRVRRKASVQLGALREFSATRVKSLIHVDLIAYAEDVIDKTNTKAVAPACKQASHAIALVSDRVDSAKKDAKTAMETAKERLSALSEAQRERLRLALTAARDRAVAARATVPVCLGHVKRRALDAAALSWGVISSHRIGDMHKDVYSLARQVTGLESQGEDYRKVIQAVLALRGSVKNLVLLRSEEIEQDKEIAVEDSAEEEQEEPGLLPTLQEEAEEAAQSVVPDSKQEEEQVDQEEEEEETAAAEEEEEEEEEDDELLMDAETDVSNDAVDASLMPPSKTSQRSSMGQGKK